MHHQMRCCRVRVVSVGRPTGQSRQTACTLTDDSSETRFRRVSENVLVSVKTLSTIAAEHCNALRLARTIKIHFMTTARRDATP